MDQAAPIMVAQLTDTHLFADESQTMRGFPTVRSFQAVLNRLAQLEPRPDLLLLTGDLSQDETIASYQQLRDRLAPLQIPAYWIAGNHDQSLEDMAAVLNGDWVLPEKSFQRGGWHFVLLNSMLPQQVQGKLSDEALAWLEQKLEQFSDQPTLVSLHHPPLAIGSAWMDAIGLENREALFAVLDQHPQVKLVIFGHIHQAFDRWRNGVQYLGAPSTCIQFAPDANEFAIDPDRQPGFRLLTLFANGRYDTQVIRITGFS
ncbi:3',5'-cyclic-AMP phosphodiesterase [Phormidium tenue FACHB-886]|nr:3',5'-cyclic-AMP phosphodiesterase [Phormidium tenue FACHB-886]